MAKTRPKTLASSAQPDRLARVFLNTLASDYGATTRPLRDSPPQHDLTLDELDGDEGPGAIAVRPDLAALAVLVARAIEAESGLARRLRCEAPIVTLQTHSADQIEIVKEVVSRCALAKGTLIFGQGSLIRRPSTGSAAMIVAREGKAKEDNPERGNKQVATALHLQLPIVGIAPDPGRHLPSSLSRTAEYRLRLAALDASAVALVIEAVTGSPPSKAVDDSLLLMMEIEDVLLAVRSGRTADECIAALEELIARRGNHLTEGPSLEDLDGYGEARRWGLELAADIADYKAGRITWEDVDHKGLLLSGAPGLGKTMFAKALARSARVPLISTSVADWNAAPYLSGTLQAIARSFEKARRQAPAILFIDELDGISDRSRLSGDYVEYWSQIVNLFLEALSNEEGRRGVVVVAATNHPNRIDPAVRRSGRLDREIALEKPDTFTLARIFRHHLGPNQLPNDDLMQLATVARGATGADIEAIVRRASGIARRARRDITSEDILSELNAGFESVPQKDRWRIALHEVGHAIVSHELGVGTLIGCSIHGKGGQLEFKSDLTGSATLDRFEDELATWMAGRAAERLVLGAASIGAGMAPNSDLAIATRLACALELRSGLGGLGSVYVETTDMLAMPGLAVSVRGHLERAEERALAILSGRVGVLKLLASRLADDGYLPPQVIEKHLEDYATRSADPALDSATHASLSNTGSPMAPTLSQSDS